MFKSGGKCRLIYKNKPLSSKLRKVSDNLNLGLHSLRAGGVTVAANSRISDRCLKRHGRWKTDASKDGYIEDSFDSRIEVSKFLGL